MQHFSELETVLSKCFHWHKARLTYLVQILQALFRVRTINLTQIAAAFQTHVKQESSYRRVRRFFADFSFDVSQVVWLILRLFPLEGRYLLILDRTNWKRGHSSFNLLVLSVAYRGIGIPIFWTALDRDGVSPLDKRVSLLTRALDRFGRDRIEALVADREFVGKEWFRFLVEERIPFVIRSKGLFVAEGIRNGYPVPLKELCKHLGRSRKIVNRPVVLWGVLALCIHPLEERCA